MQLYSKRNKALMEPDKKAFLHSHLRSRLVQEIRYISGSDTFLDKCFLVNNQKENCWYFRGQSMRDFTERNLGYDITGFYNFNDFSPIPNSLDDYILFDLVEIILIFAKETQRESVRKRFQKHFEDEQSDFHIRDFLIIRKSSSGLKPYVSIISDKILREKLEQYYSLQTTKNYLFLASITADITQLLFSDKKKGKTKTYTEKLVLSIAKKSVRNKDVKSFSELLNETVKRTKELNNQISNIRHTDKNTTPVDNQAILKLIIANNIYLAELVIFSDQEKYFFNQRAKDFKEEYIKKYNIPEDGWIVKKIEINLDDIPF